MPYRANRSRLAIWLALPPPQANVTTVGETAPAAGAVPVAADVVAGAVDAGAAPAGAAVLAGPAVLAGAAAGAGFADGPETVAAPARPPPASAANTAANRRASVAPVLRNARIGFITRQPAPALSNRYGWK